jgi:5-methylcytosine-specific restriction enzyme subunit McrC
MLHSTEDGDVRLISFLEENLNKLYEKFILNYCIKHYPKLKPASSEIKWAISGATGMLPKMQSDIMLTSDNRKLIIDANFIPNQLKSIMIKTVFTRIIYIRFLLMSKMRL